MNKLLNNHDYKNWLIELKSNIQQSQIKAALAVNSQLIQLYWDLGRQITEKQETAKWGSGFIEQLSKDLRVEFPDMKGFSKDNLLRVKKFYLYYSQHFTKVAQLVPLLEDSIQQQSVTKLDHVVLDNLPLLFQIPWGHHVLIMQKIKDVSEAIFYVKETIKNNWSRAVLVHQIESNLYERQGKAVSNFQNTLPKPKSDLTNQLLKDPYNFDFLTMTENYNERDLEKSLTQYITDFLLELGAGFAFVGKQYQINLGDKEYFIDLLFYHLTLRCYVVIELKVVEFNPEFAGKLNFYLNVIDAQLKHESDKPTIGLIICKTKDNIEAEYALKGIEKPIGISEYELNKILPEELKSSLPSIEEIENELRKMSEDSSEFPFVV
ncbi:MAG TPA: PDDEXK nuclease domain-containing protein [Pyrinomonadaceae bacterium]|nr:PDDEXK nuclease domain-containing protein [Pyrinomonadaceae bacterium]